MPSILTDHTVLRMIWFVVIEFRKSWTDCPMAASGGRAVRETPGTASGKVTAMSPRSESLDRPAESSLRRLQGPGQALAYGRDRTGLRPSHDVPPAG